MLMSRGLAAACGSRLRETQCQAKAHIVAVGGTKPERAGRSFFHIHVDHNLIGGCSQA